MHLHFLLLSSEFVGGTGFDMDLTNALLDIMCPVEGNQVSFCFLCSLGFIDPSV